jgi:hypothetical protein
VRCGDGWTVHAWHGISVPERVISAPVQLTAQDWSGTRDVEVRRVIQERMGERFVEELGGEVIDNGPRGTLYKVDLPNDPEEVALYLQVHDMSTERTYYLRVPPTIQTAEEAVAWTFGLKADEYRPIHES